MPRPTVLIADDHTILAEGLARLVGERYDVVGIVHDGAALLEAATRLRPDVIITDLEMPSTTGLAALTRLRALGIPSKVIVLTMHGQPGIAARALKSGASGFLLKDSAGEELMAAVEHVLHGRVYLPAAMTRDVLDTWTDGPEAHEIALTPRQIDVLRLIVKGQRMKEIGATLGLSTRTVETHKYEIMRVLGMQSTAELVRYAIERRLA